MSRGLAGGPKKGAGGRIPGTVRGGRKYFCSGLTCSGVEGGILGSRDEILGSEGDGRGYSYGDGYPG
jgi:hypothetical protein